MPGRLEVRERPRRGLIPRGGGLRGGDEADAFGGCPLLISDRFKATFPAAVADESLKHDSSIPCGELARLPKAALTNSVGILSQRLLEQVDKALRIALELPGPG